MISFLSSTRLVLVSLILLLAGCSSAIQSPDAMVTATSPAQIQLRITNGGATDIKNLTVIFPEEKILFGDVAAGTTTEYQTAAKGVYRYAAYQYEQDGEILSQPVIDWVGEEPVGGTRFTYVLDYLPARSTMERIRLIEGKVDAP